MPCVLYICHVVLIQCFLLVARILLLDCRFQYYNIKSLLRKIIYLLGALRPSLSFRNIHLEATTDKKCEAIFSPSTIYNSNKRSLGFRFPWMRIETVFQYPPLLAPKKYQISRFKNQPSCSVIAIPKPLLHML